MYSPRATLGNGIEIPTILEGSSVDTICDSVSKTDRSYQLMAIDSIALLVWIQRYGPPELGVLLKSGELHCH